MASLTDAEQSVLNSLLEKAALEGPTVVKLGYKDILHELAQTVNRTSLHAHIDALPDSAESVAVTPVTTVTE